jgi:hypothetical protein
MIHIKALLPFCMLFVVAGSFAQNLNQKWSEELSTEVDAFKKCRNDDEQTINPCSKSIGESFNMVYRVNDFFIKNEARYMTGTEISEFLQTSSQWTKIGFAYTQENLTKAQELANSGKAALAIYMGEDNLGHVSIILPGELTPSGSWGLKVPNSASFFINSPQQSYLNKTLSYAFTRNMIKGVILYARQ